MHGVQMFSSELKFSVEQRKFIKSIQFRLLNFYNQNSNGDINNNKRDYHKRVNINTNNENNDYSKDLSVLNMPKLTDLANLFQGCSSLTSLVLTNFNSIVNSDIELNQILIELTIRENFFNNTISNIYYGL